MPANTAYSILLKKEETHDRMIYCCEWYKPLKSDDNKEKSKENFIVTGGLDHLVKVWALRNNELELIHTLKGHCVAVVSVTVSPNGNWVASTALDSSVCLWDVTTGELIHDFATDDSFAWNAIFSPDSSQLATAGHTSLLHIYGLEHGTLDKTIDTRGKFIHSISWSPDYKYIATGLGDGNVCIVDVALGKIVHRIEAHKDTVRSLVFSPNSRLLATSSDDGNVMVYEVESAGLVNSKTTNKQMTCVCFSPDGTRIAIASGDGMVQILLVDALAVLHTFQEHSAMVTGLQFDVSSTKLLSVSKDMCMNIYECPIPPKTKK